MGVSNCGDLWVTTTVKLQTHQPHGTGHGLQGSDEILPESSRSTSETTRGHPDRPDFRQTSTPPPPPDQCQHQTDLELRNDLQLEKKGGAKQVASCILDFRTDRQRSHPYSIFLHISTFINLFIKTSFCLLKKKKTK